MSLEMLAWLHLINQFKADSTLAGNSRGHAVLVTLYQIPVIHGGCHFDRCSVSPEMFVWCYIQVPEQFKCFTLMNCGNKSKSFLSFIRFIVVSQHRVQVSYTSSHSIKSSLCSTHKHNSN